MKKTFVGLVCCFLVVAATACETAEPQKPESTNGEDARTALDTPEDLYARMLKAMKERDYEAQYDMLSATSRRMLDQQPLETVESLEEGLRSEGKDPADPNVELGKGRQTFLEGLGVKTLAEIKAMTGREFFITMTKANTPKTEDDLQAFVKEFEGMTWKVKLDEGKKSGRIFFNDNEEQGFGIVLENSRWMINY